MIIFTILGAFLVNLNYVSASPQQQPQQIISPHPINPSQVPTQYGAYLQQIDASGAQALPVQHSFTVNHSPYTFYPKPQIFYPPQPHPQPNPSNTPSPLKFIPERSDGLVTVQPPIQFNNHQPIQFLSRTPQYVPHQIQVVNPPNLRYVQHNNIPIQGKILQGRPTVQPYISQAEKFKQQLPAKHSLNKPLEEKHYQRHQEEERPVQVQQPHTIQNHQQKPELRRKEENNSEDEDEDVEDEAHDDSEEDNNDEEESEEEPEGEEEGEEEEEDEKESVSDLPPEHNRNEYDYDNRNYKPTFDAAKYIFNRRGQPKKKPTTRYYEDEVPQYHQEKGYRYGYHKNTKSKPKHEHQRESNPAKSRFVFYDSEPKFEPYEQPRRIKGKRIEVKDEEPTHYYYNSSDPKPNNGKSTSNNYNNNRTKDSKPQATRKKMVREKWFLVTKET